MQPNVQAVNDSLHCDSAIASAKAWLAQYFSGFNPDIGNLSLKASGTPFQQEVWKHLCFIPCSCTVTYEQVTAEIAESRGMQRMSAQAVRQAVGANPISIIIPCHRVIGANGKLTGYAGGIIKKIWLLNHEWQHTKRLCQL